jgi:hypothetical protein
MHEGAVRTLNGCNLPCVCNAIWENTRACLAVMTIMALPRLRMLIA